MCCRFPFPETMSPGPTNLPCRCESYSRIALRCCIADCGEPGTCLWKEVGRGVLETEYQFFLQVQVIMVAPMVAPMPPKLMAAGMVKHLVLLVLAIRFPRVPGWCLVCGYTDPWRDIRKGRCSCSGPEAHRTIMSKEGEQRNENLALELLSKLYTFLLYIHDITHAHTHICSFLLILSFLSPSIFL